MNIMKKPDKTHIEWLKTEFEDEESIATSNNENIPHFLKILENLLNSKKSGSITMNAERIDSAIPLTQNELRLDRAINLYIKNIDKDLVIEGLAIKKLTVICANDKRPLITIKNSLIKRLSANTNTSGGRLR